jgi:hypothetical protein
MRYGCSQDAGGASGGNAERLPGSNRSRRSENDHHALWSIATFSGSIVPLLRYYFLLRWMLFCGIYHAEMDGRCEPLHLIIHLEKH